MKRDLQEALAAMAPEYGELTHASVAGEIAARRVEIINHVRVGVRRAPKTMRALVAGHHGNPGRTLCGADLTDRDLVWKDAVKPASWDWIKCEACRRLVKRGAA